MSGRMPTREELLHEFFHDKPPPEMSYRAVHKLVAIDADDNLVGLIDCCEDLIATGVGHVGFFQISTSLYGKGVAHALYVALETWLVSRGAFALRLGVVAQNTQGLRFWQRQGFQLSRTRENVTMGALTNTLHVMVKFIEPMTMASYWRLMPRDNPAV